MVVYEFGPFRLDVERLLLYLDSRPVALGPKVVETLLALVESAGAIAPKRALLERVWPEGYIEEGNLTQNVYVLRKLLRAHHCDGAIETIARRGYRFTIPVRRIEIPAVAVHPRPRSWWSAGVAAFALLAFGAGAWSYGLSHEPATPAPLTAQARLDAMGTFFLSLRTTFSLHRAVTIFTRAVDADAGSANAYAGRAAAEALIADYAYGPIAPARERALARADVRRALERDPRNGRAYGVQGLLDLNEGRDGEALTTLSTAQTLAPGDADIREWYAIALLSQGQVSAAQTQLLAAQRLSPLSVAATSWLAFVAYLQHRYPEAIAGARQGLAVSPARDGLWITLGLAQEAQGRYREALTSFRRYAASCRGCRGEGAALMAYVYARIGHLEIARRELAVASSGEARPEDLALALVVVGDHGPALRRLIRRFTRRDRTLIAQDPRVQRLSGRDLRLFQGQG